MYKQHLINNLNAIRFKLKIINYVLYSILAITFHCMIFTYAQRSLCYESQIRRNVQITDNPDLIDWFGNGL